MTYARDELAGWAEYGYCASHSRFFWGLRLHLIATLGGLPIGFTLTGAKADERQTLLGILSADPSLAASRPGQILIGDKNYYGRGFDTTLARGGVNSPGKTGFASIVAAIHRPYRWRYDLLPRPTFATQPSQKRRSGAGR